MSIRSLFLPALLLGLLAAACDSASTPATSGGGGGGGGGGDAEPLVITTDKGPVEGSLTGSTRAFLGIPYAAPPVGELRWKPPAPAAAWTDPLKATKPGRPCPQLSILTGAVDTTSGEDCLTLNVWTPSIIDGSPPPVLVWIHGGAFILGSGGDPSYSGQALSEATGAIVVTLNYRLGPLGFLAHPALKSEDPNHPSSGGYGLEDQRAALAWVKENIAAFGGDPARVTIFGESAGGMSVCMHMVSPPSKGLYQRAIIESGPCDRGTPETDAFAQAAQFVTALGCDMAAGDAETLACLREKPVDQILLALPTSNDLIFGDGANWFPVFDGWNLPDAPAKLIASGSFEKVPVILGSNADEGTLFFQLGGTMIPDDTALEALVEKMVPGKGPDVLMHYSTATHGTAQAAAMAMVGDAGFVCPTRRMARSFSKGGAGTYLYHFTYSPPGALLGDLGAFHSAEIKYVFGMPSQLLPQQLTADELTLSAAMMGYWSRFAAAGDPNGGEAAPWPKYSADKDENIVFNATISTQTGLKKDLCDFWDGLGQAMP
ncbi:MAG: carboxylesterase family protein [Polyangiaceae bacterium]|nr:carboxylesterase family protein [Polyangiaceae bacterium]